MSNLQDFLVDIDSNKNLFDVLIKIAKIPASTGQEAKKVDCIKDMLLQLGFINTRVDNIGNCIVTIQHKAALQKKSVLFVAHVDTACQVNGPEVKIKQDSKYIYGHGVCDNSAGVVGLLTFLRLVKKHNLHFPKDIVIVFTVGEEGLGGKCGMKEIIKKYGKSINAVVNVESHNIGRLTHKSVGQYRINLQVNTKEGGHSFRNFGRPNAIVILSSIIRDFSKKKLPQKAGKTTFNIGNISGGEGVNAIAEQASALVEIRSKNPHYFELTKKLLHHIIEQYKDNYPSIEIKGEVYADSRPGSIPTQHPLCLLVEEVQKSLNIPSNYDSGNTDGDISLAANIPTVTIGTSVGWNTHSLSEYMEKKSLYLGVKQVFAVLYSVATSF